MSTFSEQALLEKLERLSSSQDSIETLSLWMIHHRLHASASVEAWLRCFVNSGPDKRLLLVYLANDILQNARRRGADVFLDLFKPPLRHAASLTHGQKFQTSVERVLRIWKDRRVYENRFVKELQLLIEPNRVDELGTEVSTTPSVSDFKLSLVEDALTELRKFEGELKVKSAILSSLRIDISDTSSLLMLKDKSAGGQFLSQFDESTHKLQEVVECVGIEVNERKNILDMLQDSSAYQLQNKENLQNLLKDYVQLKSHLVSLQHQLKDRLADLEKAQDTATSDPSSHKDIIVSGDMELDSDSDSQEEAMPIPHPTPPPPRPPPHFVPVNPSPAVAYPPPLYAASLPPNVGRGNMLPTPHLGTPPFPTHLPHHLQTLPPNTYHAMPLSQALRPHPLGVRPPHGMPPFSPRPPLRMPASYPPMDTQRHIAPHSLPSSAVSSNYPISTSTIATVSSSIQSSFASSFHSSLPLSSLASLSSPLSSLASSLSSSLPSTQFSTVPSSFSSEEETITVAAASDSNPDDGSGGMEDNPKEFSEEAFPKSLLNDYYSDSSGSDGEEETGKPLQTHLSRRDDSEEEVHLSLDASTAVMQPTVSLSNESFPPPPSMFTSLLPASPAKPEIVSRSSSASHSTITTTTVTSTTVTSTPSRLPNPKQLQPENIKITPSLTSVLSDIFPQLSKSLENERKRKLDDSAGVSVMDHTTNSTETLTKSPKVENITLDAASTEVGGASIGVINNQVGGASFGNVNQMSGASFFNNNQMGGASFVNNNQMGGASFGDNQVGGTSSNLSEAPLESTPGEQMIEEKNIDGRPDQEMFNVPPPHLLYSQEGPLPHPNSFPPPGSPRFYPPIRPPPPHGFFPYNRPPFPPRTRYPPPPQMYPRQHFRPGFRGGPPPHNFRPRFH